MGKSRERHYVATTWDAPSSVPHSIWKWWVCFLTDMFLIQIPASALSKLKWLDFCYQEESWLDVAGVGVWTSRWNLNLSLSLSLPLPLFVSPSLNFPLCHSAFKINALIKNPEAGSTFVCLDGKIYPTWESVKLACLFPGFAVVKSIKTISGNGVWNLVWNFWS